MHHVTMPWGAWGDARTARADGRDGVLAGGRTGSPDTSSLSRDTCRIQLTRCYPCIYVRPTLVQTLFSPMCMYSAKSRFVRGF
jgi:hypothetical protein